jgi:EAL domain-containing protein (putative c-di-GMP-specific phosphodiesterase class I)
VASALQTLKARGVDIALDDFGTGYASLSHLKNFPVDTIKIDRSFITDLGKNTGDTAIVCALLGLASDLDMTVVAEGIETAKQAAFLRERNCDLGQGYFFGKAVSATLVAELIEASDRGALSRQRTAR